MNKSLLLIPFIAISSCMSSSLFRGQRVDFSIGKTISLEDALVGRKEGRDYVLDTMKSSPSKPILVYGKPQLRISYLWHGRVVKESFISYCPRLNNYCVSSMSIDFRGDGIMDCYLTDSDGNGSLDKLMWPSKVNFSARNKD